MQKKKLFTRLLSFVLCLVMVASMLPAITPMASAADLDISNKVADPSSFNNWKNYYGTNSILPDGSTGASTWKAGGVWTDKSVYASASDFESPNLVTLDKNNFLVALSALASNKEVEGESFAPTDTMLVLDVSGSMVDNTQSLGYIRVQDRNGVDYRELEVMDMSLITSMVEATNATIESLMEQNPNNRVGVVLYSGNTSTNQAATSATATVVLPLGRYTDVDGEYLAVDAPWSDPVQLYTWQQSGRNGSWVAGSMSDEYVATGSTVKVEVKSGLTTEGENGGTGTAVGDSSKTVSGGTYIQNGLYQAMNQFLAVSDTTVPAGRPQAGAERMPAIVLMSDGAPTIATTNYTEIGNSNVGNGGSTNNRITFLTQLTAAYVRGKVADHYGKDNEDVLFMTVGLGTENSADATATLYPAGSNDALQDYWEDYFGGSVTVETNRGNATINRNTIVEAMDYVDTYYYADDADGLIQAFEDIVAEIGLQVAYSPTLVESGDADLDGYITVQDELGSMMEVKDVKGILIGNTRFSGVEIAKAMTDGTLGTIAGPTEFGNELVRTVKERIPGTDTTEAQQLIDAAYNDGQLYYTDANNWSNYIGWYANAAGEYVGFWDKDEIYDEHAPEGAVYANKSYGYLGGSASTEGSADMMHIVVMVRTEIATGHQTVLFKIPSSLIPKVEYKVELHGDSMETSETANLTVTEADPIRLVYEVGLPDDVNSVNIDQKVKEYLDKNGSNHIHKDSNGNYVFYANNWDDNHDEVAPNISNYTDENKLKLTNHIAESHFVPNTANERFYIQEDSVIYTKSGDTYTEVSATATLDTNTDYYFLRYIVTGIGENAKVEKQYELLQDATVGNANNFKSVDGKKVVKAGTIRQQLSNIILPKSNNVTSTIANTDQLWVYVANSNDPADYNIYSFLGNNGKLTVAPATGIKVTKNVTEYAEGDTAETSFAITVTLSQAQENAVVTDANGVELPDSVWSTEDNKTFVLNLKHGESAYITGLAAGVTYTVTENAPKYVVSYTGATATVAGTIVEGTVTNDALDYGNLYITKEVKHAFGGEAFPKDHKFEFEVAFKYANGDPIANTTFQLENNYDTDLKELTTDANGVMKGKLRHGETVFIKDIPAGASVTVTEVNAPATYRTAYESINQSGDTPDNDGVVTIVGEKNATVVVTNTYTPAEVNVAVNFNGTKKFDATKIPAEQSSTFNFQLQKYDGTNWDKVEEKSVTIQHGANGQGTFSFSGLNLQFDRPGTEYYRIVEIAGDNTDITYDRSVYSFSVVVILDGDGNLQANVVGNTVNKTTDGYTVDAVFTNEYHTTATSIEITKTIEDNANSGKTPAGFVIETYNATVDANGNWILGNKIRETATDAQGKAVLVRNYDNDDFDGVTGNQKTYHFIIKEKNAGETINGWTYDTTQYRVTVVLTKDSSTEKITADFDVARVDTNGNVTYLDVGDTASIAFANTYNSEEAEVDLDVKPTVAKDLGGRALAAGEFKFAIFKDGDYSFTSTDNALMIGTNDANGHIIFQATNYGVTQGLADATNHTLAFSKVGRYDFDIVEIKGNLSGVTYDSTIYDLVVDVTDNGTGTLSATHYFEDAVGDVVTFNNTFAITGSEDVTISGKKILNGRSMVAGEFEFGLYRDAAFENLIETTTNHADGTFSFSPITYTPDHLGENGVSKTYTYFVKEIKGGKGGVKYDETVHTVTVTVSHEAGELKVTATGNANIAITNTYKAASVTPNLSVKKVLSGDWSQVESKSFTFELYSTGADFDITNKTSVEYTPTLTFNNDQEASFEISLPTFHDGQEGFYYYVLKEQIPDERAGGVAYDATEYHVTVNVTDPGNGQLSAIVTLYHPGHGKTVENNIAIFTNDYSVEPTEITLEGTKTYVDKNDVPMEMDEGMFDFVVLENDDVVATGYNKVDGTIAFEPIRYTAAGEHTYSIVEVSGDAGGVVYSDAVFTVKVKVVDNGNGTLTATADYNNTEVEFKNIYNSEAAQVVLKGSKILSGDWSKVPAENKNFGFELYPADEDFKVTGDAVKAAEVGTDNTFSFDSITYNEAGTYYYVLTEKDNDKPGIIYDESEIWIKVVVEDNGTGKLIPTVTTNVTGATIAADAGNAGLVTVSELSFTNKYEAKPVQFTPDVMKKLYEGDEMKEFTFVLSGEGIETQTKQNDAEGNIVFDPITFREAGTYTFTVKEKENLLWGFIKWDTNVYNVEVKVVDTGLGALKVESATITSQQGRNDLVFRNVHEDLITEKDVFLAEAPTVSVDGKKVQAGDTLLYTITYTNYTGAVAELVTITDAIPANTTYVADSADNGGVYEDGELTWQFADVAADDSITVSFRVKVASSGVSITNQGQVQEGVNTYETNVVTTPSVDDKFVKDVFLANALTTSVDGKKVKVGDTLLYTITYTNANDQVAVVTITDTIPANTTYVADSVSSGGVHKDGKLTWEMKLAAGESRTVFFQVKVALDDVTITNQATAQDGENIMKTNRVLITSPADPAKPDSDNPETSDNSNLMLWFTLMITSIAGICIVLFAKKRVAK